jgi:hypothetical protein
VSIPLAVLEDIIDRSGAAARIAEMLPAAARRRQLTARTLLLGMLLVLADNRPAQLTRVRAALIALPEADQIRLGVIADWKTGPHQLTYRQVEHTCRQMIRALLSKHPGGAPSPGLQAACDSLPEATIPPGHAQLTRSLAADWTDVETWSRPPPRGTTRCADPEASWGHRNSNLPGPRGEMFFGYFLSAAVMVAEEDGPAVPELARRMTVCSCRLDPARALVPVLTAMPAAGIPLGAIIDDSGYATATPMPGPSRSGAPARSWCRTCTRMTAGPAAPAKAPSSPTATFTARARPARCSSSRRCRPAPPASRQPPTTHRQPSWPATSSAGTPPATPMAITALPAPPPRERSAARSGPHP